jgi:NAD(P)-dependent dehydrogenase (short-subunit alcohol dehydrogenase family)
MLMSVLDRLRLDGRRVFMTGGSRGLGREMALAMAGVGADITLTGRNADSLEAVAGEIEDLGRRATTIVADMADPDTCARVCAEALERSGPFDILVNNIGGRRLNVPLQEMPLDQWRALLDLNLTSTFLCCKAIGGAMIERGTGGRIINIASINGMVAGRGIEGRHYEAAKGAVLMLTRSLAVDWAKHGITVNAICPGIFGTDPNRTWAQKNPEIIEGLVRNIPMGHLGEPEDLGPLAVYLASDAARYVTGAAIVIDGGYTCL